MLIDTHCHLQERPLADDPAGVLGRARDAGVRWIVAPGIDVPSSRLAVDLARRYAGMVAAVGVHPERIEETGLSRTNLDALDALIREGDVTAVGEIGLDAVNAGCDDLERQEAAFRAQLALARDHGLPVLVHGRGSPSRLFEESFGNSARARMQAFCMHTQDP